MQTERRMMPDFPLLRAVALLLMLGAAGLTSANCGRKGVAGSDAPEIQVDPSTTALSFNAVAAGQTERVEVIITNTGTAPLDLKNVYIEYPQNNGAGQFNLENPPQQGTPVFPVNYKTVLAKASCERGGGVAAASQPGCEVKKSDDVCCVFTQASAVTVARFYVTYTSNGQAAPAANLIISSNDPKRGQLTIPLVTGANAPVLETDPGLVAFKNIDVGTNKSTTVTVQNSGNADLVITNIITNGDKEFTVSDLPNRPHTMQPGEKFIFSVSFAPSHPNKASGEIIFESNDPRGNVVLPLVGNSTGKCLVVSPADVDFGSRPIGVNSTLALTLTSCGSEALTIKAISMKSGSSPDFGTDNLPPMPGILPPGQSRTITVTYLPKEEGADTGALLIESDADGKPLSEIPVKGVGSLNNCPTAVIKALPNEAEMKPQEKIAFDGTASTDPDGTVVKYKWTVVGPTESVSVFQPSDSVPKPTFEVNVAGTYTFKLDVWDDGNNKSCNTAEFVVQVIPDAALHVELTWVTPGDSNEKDECPNAYLTRKFCGSDLDLHLLHKNANDYFSFSYDCYFQNPKPKWGVLSSTADDPRLDRDDIDGGGPENINLDKPEANGVYRIGVHFWSAHSYGDATAKVKIYWYGNLVKEFTRKVSHWQLWDVAIISGNGVVTEINGIFNNIVGDIQ